jgi:hypothetical protein
MNRTAGIVVAAIGLLMAVVSTLKLVPGLTGTGVILILLGGLIIGLSFIDKPNPDGAEKMSTPATLANIFFSPAEVFRNLRRHPRWLAALIITSLLSATFANLFLMRLGPERVANYAIDKTLEMPMIQNNDEARRSVEAGRADAVAEARNPVSRAGSAVSGFAMAVFGSAFLGAIFFLFAIAMGGKLNYWQAFSAVVYAAFPVNVIRYVLNTIVLFLKDPTDIHPLLGQSSLITDNLGVLFAPGENPVLYSVASCIGILWFYWVFMNAIGLSNAGERVSSSTGWTASISVYVLVILFAAVTAFLFPSFLS